MRYAVAIFLMEVSKQTYFIWTGPDPLVLQMILRPYINAALASLMGEPQAHIVLKHPGPDKEVSPETEALRSGQEFCQNCVIPNKKVYGTKVKSGIYSKWRDVDVDAKRIYGLSFQEHLFNLLDYGQLNGGYISRLTQMQGSCMFHALHKGIKCPREFTNMHLRKMVVLFMVENFEMLWPLLHICVLNNFGHLRLTKEEFHAKMTDGSITDAEQEAYTELGSFSVHVYLKNLLMPGFYQGELCLLIITMIWKVKITVLHAESLVAIKFRHMNQSMKADFILVHCSGSHYIPLGMNPCITFSFKYTPFIHNLFTIYHLYTNFSLLYNNYSIYTAVILFIQYLIHVHVLHLDWSVQHCGGSMVHCDGYILHRDGLSIFNCVFSGGSQC